MKLIRKYPLGTLGSSSPVTLQMPRRAIVVSAILDIANLSDAAVCAIIDPEAELQSRRFVVVNNEQPFADAVAHGEFIGTVSMSDKMHWHVFEVD